jgi:acylphosphatase
MTVEARRWLATGRVQAVGYRLFAQRAGERLGLDGWVRNLPDGRTVETFAQGEAAALDQFAAALRTGPPGSRVATLDIHPAGVDHTVTGFSVRH